MKQYLNLIILVFISLLSFYLSFSCYGNVKPPIGLRLIHATTAGSLNIFYIMYYVFGRFFLGWTC